MVGPDSSALACLVQDLLSCCIDYSSSESYAFLDHDLDEVISSWRRAATKLMCAGPWNVYSSDLNIGICLNKKAIITLNYIDLSSILLLHLIPVQVKTSIALRAECSIKSHEWQLSWGPDWDVRTELPCGAHKSSDNSHRYAPLQTCRKTQLYVRIRIYDCVLERLSPWSHTKRRHGLHDVHRCPRTPQIQSAIGSCLRRVGKASDIGLYRYGVLRGESYATSRDHGCNGTVMQPS